MEVAKVTSKGQITIPIAIRRNLEINEGDKILFVYKPGGVMMVNPNKLEGGMPEDVVEAPEVEVVPKEKKAPKAEATKTKIPKAEPKKAKAPVVKVDESAQRPEVETVKKETKPEAKSTPMPTPPPPKTSTESKKPEASKKSSADFDLNSLLDDLRSMGSI